MFNRLENLTSGTIKREGVYISKLFKKNLLDRRKTIGMIFQHFNLLESKTVEENVAIPFILNHTPKEETKQKVAELLSFVELSDKAKAYPGQLSGGQKQRVGIARALALNPSILLCDEATSALDPRTTESILNLLQKVNVQFGVTILMITHQMNVIQQICTHVAILEKGEIVETGTVHDVFGNPTTKTAADFVRTVINDRLPDDVIKFLSSYNKPQAVLRLRFEGNNADSPVLSDAIKATGVNISILSGIVTELEGKVIGFQSVQLTGAEVEISKAIEYLQERKVGITNIDFNNQSEVES